MFETLFWIFFAIVTYTFVGYALVLWILVKLKKLFVNKEDKMNISDNLPEVCLFVTAYNEVDYVDDKVLNSFQLNYPKDKIKYLWISDGSNDGTSEKLKKYEKIQVESLPERKGKIHAMNHGMKFVESQIVIFSDSNTMLASESVMEIVQKFQNPKVGCVAGEKRIVEKDDDNAAASGENIYWRIESWMKKMDADLNSAIGADGGLFAIRKELFDKVDPDIILDDFVISLKIAQKGYKIAYAPNAYASETASVNVKEELKRKIRIAAGGIQAISRLPGLLNPFRNGWLCFQYFSHKVLRWTVAPFSLFGLFLVNFLLVIRKDELLSFNFFSIFFILQLTLYLFALLSRVFNSQAARCKLFFIPYYFLVMNFASVAGIFRYLRGKQKVTWDKSVRA